MDEVSFDDPPLETPPQPAEPPTAAAGSAILEQAPPARTGGPAGEASVPDPVASTPTSSGIAYITVADASGRVLFRRPATADEVDEALRSAEEAEREGQAAMDRIGAERFYGEALEDKTR